MPVPANDKHRVVIVGAGFAGLSLAKGLAGAPSRPQAGETEDGNSHRTHAPGAA